jgi:hypothetical protein
MAKTKEKKPRPKAPENAPTVAALKKLIEDRAAKLAKAQEAASTEGKLNKDDPKFRLARKRLKRAYRKLDKEAVRLKPKKAPAPAEAAPAESA